MTFPIPSVAIIPVSTGYPMSFVGSSDGKVHCTALLNLLANDNDLDLAEQGVTTSQVHVSLRVDFTDKS